MITVITLFVWIGIVFLCTHYLGREVGSWVAIAIGGVLWFVLKLITDRQEQLLHEDLKNMDPEEYQAFLEDAEKEGLIHRNTQSDKNNT